MAAGQLDNRAKLTIVVVAGLLLIFALHMLVFQKNQKALEDARRQYAEALGKINNIHKGDQRQLDEYEKKTAEFENKYKTITQNLGVDSPKFLQMWDDSHPEYLPQRAAYLRDLLRSLLKKRSSDFKVRLPFLNANYPAPAEIMGWQIPETLPPDFEKQPAKISDTLERLKDIRVVLESLSPQDIEAQKNRQSKLTEYQTELAKLGIRGDLLQFLTDRCQMGEFIPLFNLISCCDLIMSKKPKDYAIQLTGAPGSNSLEELIDYVPIAGAQGVNVMNVTFPQQSTRMLVAVRELETLNDLIDIAARNDVSSILRVRFLDPWMYSGATISSNDFYNPKAGAPILSVDMLLSAFRLPGTIQSGGKQATAQENLLSSLGGGAQGGAASQPAVNPIGVIVPIDITFVADNVHAIHFLYELAHSPRAYEINSLGFQINENKPGENAMAISVVVLAYAWVKDVSGVAPERRPISVPAAEARTTTGSATASGGGGASRQPH